MDDNFVIQVAKHSQQLIQHINSQDPHIKFTKEEPNQEGILPFLDTLVSPWSNTIKTLLMAPKDRDNKLQKMGSYMGLNAHTSPVQRNT